MKWIPGAQDDNDAAATAPKSQKYWDEHNIKRPDYAKTDAEIAMDRGGSSSLVIIWIPILLFVVGFVGYQIYVNRGGHRLGSTHFRLRRETEEEARRARLARFENSTRKQE